MGKLGTFVALGVRGRGMIENRSFNLVEFCVIMGKQIAICRFINLHICLLHKKVLF